MGSNRLDGAVFAYLKRQSARKGWAPDTKDAYTGILLQFSAAYGQRPWDQLTEPWVETWKESLRHPAPGRKAYGDSTLRDKQLCVRSFLRWLAKNWDYEVQGSGKKVRVRDVSDALEATPRVLPVNTDHKRLDADEVEAVLVAAAQHSARAFAIISLELYPGLRRVELHRMSVGDYYRGGNMAVRGKGAPASEDEGAWLFKETRRVPVGPQCQAALGRWLDERGHHPGPMFPGRPAHAGLSTQQIGQVVDEVMWASGVKKKYGDGKAGHALRHTCITDALNVQDQPIHIVQKLAGHASPATTMRYAHVDAIEMARCVNRPQYRALRKPEEGDNS